jgi:hypothetical protein
MFYYVVCSEFFPSDSELNLQYNFYIKNSGSLHPGKIYEHPLIITYILQKNIINIMLIDNYARFPYGIPYICMSSWSCVYAYAYAYIYIRTYIYIYIYIYIYMCTYVCVYTYIYIYVYKKFNIKYNIINYNLYNNIIIICIKILSLHVFKLNNWSLYKFC